MSEAYTVSKMMASINEVMAPVATEVCASVTLQRKTENGIMLNTSEKEIAYLDTKARVKHSAEQVARLDGPAKAQWVAARRLAGNDAFHRRGFQQAAEAYIQALTALDFGKTPREKLTCQQELQIPLTCNLAACMLMLEQWDKARQMCDQALALDPNSTKALMQRAKAKAKLSNFDDARADISRAKEVALASTSSLAGDGEQLVERLDKQLEDITRLEQRHKYSLQQQRKFQKKMMREAVGKLYGDKKEVNRPLVAATSDCSSSTTSNSSAALLSRGFWSTGIAWVITMVVSVVSVFSRLFPAKWSKVKTS